MTVVPVDVDRPSETNLVAAIHELQGLSFTVADGAAANVNITVAGIAAEDTVVAVLPFAVAADTGTDATGNKVTDVGANLAGEAAITSAGHIQLDTTDTTGDKLIVVWLNKTA